MYRAPHSKALPFTTHPLDYNTLIMFFRRNSIRAFAGLAAALLLLSVAFAQTAKRPLNHKDYDGWHTIIGQRLSNDGKVLAYGRSEEHTSELQSLTNLVCRLLLEKKKI